MAQFTRSWPALAALGAALLHGAVGAGAIVTGGGALAVPIGVLWIALAASQAVFGLVVLSTGNTPAPSLAVALFLLPALLWAALLLGGVGAQAQHRHAASAIATTSLLVQRDAAPLPFLPLLIASALALGVAAHSASTLRRRAVSSRPATGAPADGPTREPSAGGLFTLGLAVGSLAVSALVTPGLAATDAGRLAVPHETHAIGAAETDAAPLSPAATAGTR
ncbi:hypothetical protein [Kitasatospora indigofera]|uniref:hypothetical protein n=1 Tax=Kitasatospora indigofera TaxID=67307 RepID=UPI0036797F41